MNDIIKNPEIKTVGFLPENLRDLDFYRHITDILDWVIKNYHSNPVNQIQYTYDVINEAFKADKTLSLLGFDQFLQFNITEDQKRAMCALLANIYDLKGTERGLRYLLRLAGMDARVYEWYNINLEHARGNPDWPHEVPPCTIVLEVDVGNNPFGVTTISNRWAIPGSNEQYNLAPGLAFEDIEGKFRYLASFLLWVCTELEEIRWRKAFRDYVNSQDQFRYQPIEQFVNQYYPPQFVCPGTVIASEPPGDSLPRVGTPGANAGGYFHGMLLEAF